jgi:hypothetical protein
VDGRHEVRFRGDVTVELVKHGPWAAALRAAGTTERPQRIRPGFRQARFDVSREQH